MMENRQYSMGMKVLCFLLACLLLVGAVGLSLVALGMGELGFYSKNWDVILKDLFERRAERLVPGIVQQYLLHNWQGDSVPNVYGSWDYQEALLVYNGDSDLRYTIFQDGRALETNYTGGAVSYLEDFPVYTYWDPIARYGEDYTYETYEQREGPQFSVRFYLLAEETYGGSFAQIRKWGGRLYESRGLIVLAIGLCALGSLVAVVYLFCAAGHTRGKNGVSLSAVDRLPGDLVLAAVAGGILLLLYLGGNLLRIVNYDEARYWLLGLLVPMALAAVALALGVILTWVARGKQGGGYWWRRSLAGLLAVYLWRGLKWLGRGLRALAVMAPTMVLWLAVGLGYWLGFVFLNLTDLVWHYPEIYMLWSLLGAGIIVYAAYGVGKLKKGVARMARGDLETKVDVKHLYGTFRDMGEGLNSLGQAASRAVDRQLRSERMKTELITNVSHDIKTPLTSIINYVDLMQKPHTPEEGTQYLEVLDRQSRKLKKLTDDLVELSKASSGNLPVEKAPANAVELVEQALGEYQEKLETRRLEPVFTAQEPSAPILADGRLLWRVLDNLLGNVVKYAMEGTRVYVDVGVRPEEKRVRISVKNISAHRLNISSQELMERFVRGDAARNTEGSGLGLNIAKSLAELQGARFAVTIDGDLFKAVLDFPLLEA